MNNYITEYYATRMTCFPINNRIYLYDDKKETMSECNISIEELNEILFYNENIPTFMMEDIPEDFRLGWDSSNNIDNVYTTTKAFNTNPTAVPEQITEFIKDKEYGLKKLGFSVDYNLLGEKNISITIYEGGFVETNIGQTGKVFYLS